MPHPLCFFLPIFCAGGGGFRFCTGHGILAFASSGTLKKVIAYTSLCLCTHQQLSLGMNLTCLCMWKGMNTGCEVWWKLINVGSIDQARIFNVLSNLYMCFYQTCTLFFSHALTKSREWWCLGQDGPVRDPSYKLRPHMMRSSAQTLQPFWALFRSG